jgi:hypothetical protein
MADHQDNQNDQVDIPYLGFRVPKFLRLVYFVFIVWGAVYFGRYVWPDLMVWLNR